MLPIATSKLLRSNTTNMSFLKASLKPKFVIPALAAAGTAYYFSTMPLTKSQSEPKEPAKTALTGDWIDFKVSAIKDVSQDTKLITFAFPSKDEVSGLFPASCVLTKFVTPKGSNVIRPYTPISDPAKKGEFDILIKKYPGGKSSTHIHELKVADSLTFKGPIPKFKWEANKYDQIDLILGGTGVAPGFQVIQQILEDKTDNTKINLLYGSRTPSDILLKEELDTYAAKYPEQFKLTYFVDSAEGDKSFKGQVGYIDKSVLSKELAGPSDKSHVYICGPPGLYKSISGTKVGPTDQGEVTGILAELGYDKNTVYKF